MPATKINARDWTFEIESKDATPVWTAIAGITSFSVDRGMEEVDMTDFDSAGNYEGQAMQRAVAVTCEGFYLEDASGDRDAGQELVEDACAEVGDDSHYDFRITSPGGTVRTFTAYFNVSEPGGGNNDKTGWGFTATRSGATS